VDAIATDHAPHHFDEKNVEFDLAPFGVIGLETAFGISYDRLVRTRVVDLVRLIDLFSCGPARAFNLPGGTLRPGSVGDVTISDVNTRYQVTNTFLSKASNSPFIGETLHARAVMTIVGGVVRYDERASIEAGKTAPREAPKPARKQKKRK
jgi:dihydroorotase